MAFFSLSFICQTFLCNNSNLNEQGSTPICMILDRFYYLTSTGFNFCYGPSSKRRGRRSHHVNKDRIQASKPWRGFIFIFWTESLWLKILSTLSHLLTLKTSHLKWNEIDDSCCLFLEKIKKNISFEDVYYKCSLIPKLVSHKYIVSHEYISFVHLTLTIFLDKLPLFAIFSLQWTI